MTPFRKLLLVGVSALALAGVQACSTETELNPQPLPPQGGESTGEPQTPNKNSGDDTTGAGGASAPPAAASDAGTEGGDAADGGDG
jgi:hypothetical protein